MEVIIPGIGNVFKILAKQNADAYSYRLMNYCVQESVDGGILLFNTLTKCMVFLDLDEYNNIYNIDELKRLWFVVPTEYDDDRCARLVKQIYFSKKPRLQTIDEYTIFPTTDCNARCFYCFEKGRGKLHMSNEVALKTANYIIEHSNGSKVKIRWFGGEPLFHREAIDIICNHLRAQGVHFSSKFVSNGYLFNEQVINDALDKWNMTWVQITLDGTEKIYNKYKAYIYKDVNAFQTVLNNIEQLLKNNIEVAIRLNVDKHNADDLQVLVDELGKRFGTFSKCRVYSSVLFENTGNAIFNRDDEVRKQLYAQKEILDNKIDEWGLSGELEISEHFRMNSCIADSGHSITIMPDGNIGLCETYSESEFIGSLYTEQFDNEMIDSYRQLMEELPECKNCFRYPLCVRLKKCTESGLCTSEIRAGYLKKIKMAMKNEYKKYKNFYFTMKLADVVIGVKHRYGYINEYCKDYMVDEAAELRVDIQKVDISYEKTKYESELMVVGNTMINYSDDYLETLSVYRKIVEVLLNHNTLLFHGSVIAVDGVAYLFTAKSGTGKSTHTRLWREYFGDRAVMINDDKPLLKITEDGVIAYGTPWNGKHHLGCNMSAPLKAICILERDEDNHIEKIGKKEAYNMIVQQTHKPAEAGKLVKTLQLIDKLADKVELYRLGCNMDKDAAVVAYEGMK